MGELENQPGLRGGLDQCAGMAEEQTEPVNQVIAVAKGAKGGVQKHEVRCRDGRATQTCISQPVINPRTIGPKTVRDRCGLSAID